MPRTGRGAGSNPASRLETTATEAVDDGWGILDEPLPRLETVVRAEAARTIIARNDSPDIPFTQSINPYRGCEHGCIYCYARPSHGYAGLSPGIDFETRLFYKADAAALLERELASKGYRCSPIALGSNTDPYQPIERRYRVTRRILEVLSVCEHPATIVTKGASLIERDIGLLSSMAERNLIAVFVSVTTLDDALKRRLEPRAASAATRLAVMRKLADAGIPVGMLVAPVIPVLTDHEAESILEAGSRAGARTASYMMLRLPHEVADLFREWLTAHQPLKAAHVMSRLQAFRNGLDNDPRFGSRQTGEGIYAELFRERFELACRRHGLNREPLPELDRSRFRPPAVGPQMSLF